MSIPATKPESSSLLASPVPDVRSSTRPQCGTDPGWGLQFSTATVTILPTVADSLRWDSSKPARPTDKLACEDPPPLVPLLSPPPDEVNREPRQRHLAQTEVLPTNGDSQGLAASPTAGFQVSGWSVFSVFLFSVLMSDNVHIGSLILGQLTKCFYSPLQRRVNTHRLSIPSESRALHDRGHAVNDAGEDHFNNTCLYCECIRYYTWVFWISNEHIYNAVCVGSPDH